MKAPRLMNLIGLAVMLLAVASIAASSTKNFRTHLSGDNEAPDPRDTNAQGQAIFKLSKDGESLEYKLIVANIENVVAAHIHLGEPGENGPVVAFLFGNVPPGGGRTDGVLAEGTITKDNLLNDLAGQPLSALIEAIQSGNAYVNVHTNDGVDPANTGPGDFPGGEIRGNFHSH
ncbi:MAG TPA: CHRD domain-containing protein [Caldilineaceae bacterium]|nr:CHRD domain-containing protein [Caldilineaceae bacterium]